MEVNGSTAYNRYMREMEDDLGRAEKGGSDLKQGSFVTSDFMGAGALPEIVEEQNSKNKEKEVCFQNPGVLMLNRLDVPGHKFSSNQGIDIEGKIILTYRFEGNDQK